MKSGRTVRSGAGQSLIEACLAVAILCLVFMGFFQVSQLIAARQVLYHSAARGARAKMVGFNRFMVEKVVRVAAIPNAGRMSEPDIANEDAALRGWLFDVPAGIVWDRVLRAGAESVPVHAVEQARIPEYLGSPYWAWADSVLNYEHWRTIRGVVPGVLADADPFEVRVMQTVDLQRLFGVALHRVFYARDTLPLEGVSRLEAHYPLYIEDRNW